MTINQLLFVFRARWKLALSIILGSMLIALVVSLLMTEKYTATTAVVVDVKPDPVAGTSPVGPNASSYLGTQISIMRSENVALRVVRMLSLDQNANLREQWLEATDGKGQYEVWLANWLKAYVDIRPARDSNVVEIDFTASDPRFAAAASNAFATAYVDANLALRVEPAKQYSSFFDERIKQARRELEAAQTKLSRYQNEKGIIITDERLDVETAHMNGLSNQLVSLRTLSAESNSRSSQSRNQSDDLGTVLNNPVVAGLKTDLARSEATLDRLTARYGDQHPQVVEARANIDALRDKIASETSRVSRSVGLDNNINRAREAEVRAAYEAQRARVLKLKQERDELAVLERDVQSAQRNYDAIQARLMQVSLESQNTQANIYVLNRATEPAHPSSPRYLLNVVGGLLFGFVLSIGVVLLRELSDRRIRTAEDVIMLYELPVLARMPGAPRRRLFGRGKKEKSWLQRHVGQQPSLTHS